MNIQENKYYFFTFNYEDDCYDLDGAVGWFDEGYSFAYCYKDDPNLERYYLKIFTLSFGVPNMMDSSYPYSDETDLKKFTPLTNKKRHFLITNALTQNKQIGFVYDIK